MFISNNCSFCHMQINGNLCRTEEFIAPKVLYFHNASFDLQMHCIKYCYDLHSKYTLIKTYTSITLKYVLINCFHFYANFVMFRLNMLIKSKSYRIRLAITFYLIPDTKSFPKRYDRICHQEWYTDIWSGSWTSNTWIQHN